MRIFFVFASVSALCLIASGAHACRKCSSDTGIIYHYPTCGFHTDLGEGDSATCARNEAAQSMPSYRCGSDGTRNVFVGGEKLNTVRIGPPEEYDWSKANFQNTVDGDNLRCNVEIKSGSGFTSILRGKNRDVLDLVFYLDDGGYKVITDRIHDGRSQNTIAGTNFVARLYGVNKDVLRLYGFRDDGTIVITGSHILDGDEHDLQKLPEDDVGVIWGKNNDVRVRFCFDGVDWKWGYLGQPGNPFPDSCSMAVEWPTNLSLRYK